MKMKLRGLLGAVALSALTLVVTPPLTASAAGTAGTHAGSAAPSHVPAAGAAVLMCGYCWE